MKRVQAVSWTGTSRLTATGGVTTSREATAWVDSVTAEIRRTNGSASFRAHLWCYRDPEDCVALDLWSDRHEAALTFRIADSLDLSGGREIVVPDAIEALHLAGLVLARLGIRPSVGRGTS